MLSLLKKPGAWVPIVLSIAMLTFMFTLFTTHGVPTPNENKDEGVAAHLFQLWLVLEFFMILFFASKWLPQKPTDALIVLTIQIALIVAGCTPVFLLHL